MTILLAISPARCDTSDKTRILADLISSPTRAQARVKANQSAFSELALDLIVYRWAARSSTMPIDVKGIDEIIPSLASELNDKVINWALGSFSISKDNTVHAVLPPKDDPRVQQLTEFNRQYGIAGEFRESSPIQAVTALTTALDICQKLRLELSEALVRTLLGDHYFYDMARYVQAEDCYSHAVAIFSAYDCDESAAILSDDYGALCTDMSRYTAATENYSLAARQWLQLAKQNSGVSRYRAMAGQEYMKAGEAQSAANDPEKALQLMTSGLDQLRAAANMTKSYTNLIRNLIKVADVYKGQGNTNKALELLQAARKACALTDDLLLQAQVCDGFVDTYTATNQLTKAADESARRDKFLKDAAGTAEVAIVTLTNSTALSHDSQTTLGLAVEQGAAALRSLQNYSESASLWEKMADVYKRSALVDQQIRCLRSLAEVLDLQHKPQESLAARFEATNLAIKANKKALAADVARDMAQALIDIGDLNNALDALSELAPIIAQSGNVRGAAWAQETRGTLLATHNHFEDAISDLQEARTRYYTQVGDPWAASAVSLKLALAQEGAGKLQEARDTLESGLKDIEGRYSRQNVDPNTNPERTKLMQNLYEELTSVYIRSGAKDSAKDLVLNAKRYQWVGDLVARLKKSSNSDIAAFASSIDLASGQSDPGTILDTPNRQALLAQNWAEFAAKCQTLREQHPTRYNALRINPLEIYKSRNELPKKTLIIEYLTNSSSTYVFLCGNGISKIWELNVSSRDIDALTAKLRKTIKSCEESLSAGVPIPRINDWREPAFLEIQEPLSTLYKQLLAPLAADLSSYQMLMFALPDELAGIPMHALITSGPNEPPRFLIQDYEVGYLGEGMLGDLINKDSRSIDSSTDRLAIFADPAGNLPGARSEASLLEKLYFTSVSYVGPRATVANFVRECDKASILHIAAHYNVNPNPGKFVIKLAPDGDSDGEITVEEVTAITNPHLQLVVLSTCESAASTDPITSGPSCAAEVFSLAGAKSVLGGLWKVSDASASKLMGDFYRTLCRGKTRTNSLRSAQIEMIEGKEFAHPFYWACFALYGNPW